MIRRLTLISLFLCLSAIILLSACAAQPVPAVAPAPPPETTPTPVEAPTQPPEPSPTAVPALETPVESPTEPAPADEVELPDEREVAVTALFFLETDQGASGGTNTTTIRVRHKDTPGLRVGFFDAEVEGTGAMWQASGWTAVTLATFLLGANPEYFEFTLDAGGGRIDGPSAGGLTTVAVLAALLGDTVRADAAMTGTINPDGTIGPVGGIPQKLEGAANAGKSLVLIPAGQRYDYDMNLKRQVDLVDVGKQLGLDVRQVANIFEAYEILTGAPLPRAAAGPGADLPPRAFDKLRASTLDWLSQYQEARNRFNTLSDYARQDREPTYADEEAQLANEALEQGLAALANQRAWEAAYDAETSLAMAQLDDVYNDSGIDALMAQLDAAETSWSEFDAVLNRLKAESPRTASEAIALVDAWSNLSVAWGLNIEANVRGSRAREQAEELEEEDLATLIYEAIYMYTVAGMHLDMGRNALDTAMGFGAAPPPDVAQVAMLADIVRRAADANIALFNSVVRDPRAERAGVTTDAMHYYMLDKDADYAGAMYARYGADYLEDQVWEEPARSLMKLGNSLTAWAESAVLIAKYYSLGASMDEDFNVTEITADRALLEMLDLSEQRAQELISLVQEEEPVSPLAYAEVARVWRQGDAAQQMNALYYNWQAAAEAQMLGYFTGVFGQAVRDALADTGRPVEALQLWEAPAP